MQKAIRAKLHAKECKERGDGAIYKSLRKFPPDITNSQLSKTNRNHRKHSITIKTTDLTMEKINFICKTLFPFSEDEELGNHEGKLSQWDIPKRAFDVMLNGHQAR